MSYKVEVSSEDQESLLLGTLADWSRQEHDVHLVSTEGHKVFSHKVILAFYSSFLMDILNDPVSVYSSGPVTISVPASASCISTMLRMLVQGKVGTNDMNLEDQIRDASKALGISIKNFEIEHRKKPSTTSKLTITKMPAGDEEGMVIEPESINEKDPKREKEDLFLGPKKTHKIKNKNYKMKKTYKKSKGKWNTSVVNNGMKTELKDFISEETSENNEVQTSKDTVIDEIAFNHKAEKNSKNEEIAKFTCDICMGKFKHLDKHKYNVHGFRKTKEKSLKASESSPIVKEESFRVLESEESGGVSSSKNTQSNTKSIFMNQTKKDKVNQEICIENIDNQSSTPEKILPQTKSKDGLDRLHPVPGPDKTLNKMSLQPSPANQINKSRVSSPSPCQLCPKVFDTPENLSKHINLRHPGAMIPSVAKNAAVKEKKSLSGHQCPVCDKMFNNAKIKEVHMLRFHRDVNPNFDPLKIWEILEPLNNDTDNLLKNKSPKVVTETEGGATIETEEIPEMTDPCGYCGDKFDNIDILNEHIAMMHT